MKEADLLRAVQNYRIAIRPKFSVLTGALGQWESPYPGKGFDFFSARDFVPGDDLRRLHLPTSQRRGVPTVVERIELRDVTMMLYVDCSASMRLRNKHISALRAASLLTFGAFKLESSFGFGTLNDHAPIMRPRTGEEQFFLVWKALHAKLSRDSSGHDRERAVLFRPFIEHLVDNIPLRSVVFLISDFLGASMPQGVDEKVLRAISQRYDIIPIIVQDKMEYDFPVFSHSVCYPFQDVETGDEAEGWVWPADQRRIAWVHQQRLEGIRQMFRRTGMPSIHPVSWELPDLFKQFEQFFAQRR